MSQKKVLVIDDSATIRRLVDASLSPVGYDVTLAANAEEGVARAAELRPDLIILDHQLPGTTGVDVCAKLLANEELRNIPVIASSTLRKKAYVEYADCPNVVDMLPKPYTAELLVTTVANALDTATMVVDSQRDGTAVPEVIQQVGDVALAGDFDHFSLRAVLDFLNNAAQQGVLELEGGTQRVWVYVDRGRVQAITASGANTDDLIEQLPESLRDLGPVLRLTVAGASCTQVDGLVQLLDNKVLDPRLLQKLLRHQAALLLMSGFTARFKTFRFDGKRRPPALHDRLQLDISAVALLVEACLASRCSAIPQYSEQHVFSRKAMRGQNLDRAGLAAHHQKLLAQLNEPSSLGQLVQATQVPADEARRVLHGLVLADLVEAKLVSTGRKVIVLEVDPQATVRLRDAAQRADCPVALKVVRDRLSLQLLLKRQRPDVLVVALDTEVGQQILRDYRAELNDVAWIGIDSAAAESAQAAVHLLLPRPYELADLFAAVEQATSHCV